MRKLLFSILFLIYVGNILAQDKKNQVGLEVLKPMYSLLHSKISNQQSNFWGYNMELAYTRVITPYFSYRASGGITKYGLENSRFSYEYRSEGGFLKQGFDFFPAGEGEKFDFILGLSGIVSNYKEKQRGFFIGKYYPTEYTSYDRYNSWVFGAELALRFRWLLGDNISLELSNKIAIRGMDSLNKLEKMYIPGFGPMLSRFSPFNAVSYPGMELKLYFRF